MGWYLCAARTGSSGQLDVGGNESRVVPTLVRGELEGRKVLQIAVGFNHTVCVTEDRAVLRSATTTVGSWACMGVGDQKERLVPTLLRGELENSSVLQVAAGSKHTMFVTADGMVFACGYNNTHLFKRYDKQPL